MKENEFWKICEALDSELRLELVKYLLAVEKTEFPCVNELAERFKVTSAAMSVHLKKLLMVGLVTSKREDRRVYYRAFASTTEGMRVIESLRDFFATGPNEDRVWELKLYAHALSHHRRNAIVRCLQKHPGLSLDELAIQTDMPPQTADRLWGKLDKAHIVDLNGSVVRPSSDPEALLLELTLA